MIWSWFNIVQTTSLPDPHMSLVISPLANPIRNILFGSSSNSALVLDRVNPEATEDIKAPVIPMPTIIIIPPRALPSALVMLGPKVGDYCYY